ncbi:unnamed protein product [Rhizoctonia solani]|uniref:BTB domain-containing protein n=1 Tax=Rhizoctonia solani TaxID=456999 RepID=A0A8H3HB33_9AGAM|nr:unnamed protein product [Rhizoctonia solani]
MESPVSSCGLSLSYASISDMGDDATGSIIVAADPEPNISAPPAYKGIPFFDPQDGDIQIFVNGTRFETHRYLIKRFQGIKLLLNNQPLMINIQREDISAEDFSEMFKVLYASIITGPFEFAPHTLISTLRVASVYEYHSLRDYCVQHLEALELDAVKRIEIAHEFRLTAWQEPAYHDLGMRDEPITREEAKIIGLDAFVTIAEMREKEQRRRGKIIDAIEVVQDGWSPESAPTVGEASAQHSASAMGKAPYEEASHSNPPTFPLPYGNKQDTNDILTCGDNNMGARSGLSFNSVELNGTYNWRSKYGYRIEIPGSLKDIQAQQLAHANGISSLELSVKKLNTTVATLGAKSFVGHGKFSM